VRPAPASLRLLRAVALAVAILAPADRLAYAQAAAVPPELSEDARKAYAQGLREARDLVARKEFATAATRIDALVAQRPREPQARFLKGVVETERGDRDAAIATFRALSQDYPELPEPYNNLAVLYAQRGDYEGARIALESALGASPDWALAHENLGDVHARIAAVHYGRATALDRDGKSAAVKLALVRELLAPTVAAATPASAAAPAATTKP
jgi:Flp pilus assembly protein TadD